MIGNRTLERVGADSLIIEKSFTILTILAAFFHQYDSPLPGVTLGEFLLIFVILIITLTRSRTVIAMPMDHFLQLFLAYLVLTFISMIFQGSFNTFIITRWLRYSSYAIMVFYQTRFLQYTFALRVYKGLCLFVSIYIIAQFFSFLLLGVYLPIKILPISWSRLFDTQVLLDMASRSYFRAYGVFAEPGYSAKFLLPGLALSLFGWGEGDRVDIISLIIIATAIVFTTSVQGLVVGLLTIAMFIFVVMQRGRKNVMFLVYGILIIGLILGVIFISSVLGLTEVSVGRIFAISKTSTGSTGIRLFRGFAVFEQLPIKYKLLGTGLGNIDGFVKRYNITTYYDSSAVNDTALSYMSGISGILVASGIIGLIFFSYWFYRTRSKLPLFKRVILYQFVVLLFGGGGLFTMTSVFYLAILNIPINGKKVMK